MSSKKKKTNATPKNVDTKNNLFQTLGKKSNVIYLGLLFVLLLVFFNDVVFQDNTFLPPDRIASKSIGPYLDESFENGNFPLWNPYIFSGMPSFASLQSAPYVDLVDDVIRIIKYPISWIVPNADYIREILNLLLFGLFIYLLFIKKSAAKPVAFFAAVAMVFQPQVIAFIAHGHGSKLTTSVMIPIVFFVLDEFLEKRQLRYFALLALAIGLQLLRAHTQISYYTFMMVGLYIIFWAIYTKKSDAANTGEIAKSIGFSAVALVIGVAMSSWLYMSVLEYADYSIRGGGTGLDYGYATSWSFAPKEMMTFLIPSFFGFGGSTYWGEMVFTDFPLYMGIIPLFLAGVALMIRRDKYVFFFAIMSFFALLVSFGKHLPFFYDLLFNYLPFFNKFRVPSMVLILLQFSVVVLAGFGLQTLLQLKDKKQIERLKKFIYIFVGALAVLMIFMLVAKDTYMGWAASSAKQLQPAAQLAAYESASQDAFKMVFFAIACGALMFFFLNKKIQPNMLVAGMVLILIVDLWVVDFKITDPKPKVNEAQFFAATSAVRYLEQQDDVYRIYPVADEKPANWYAYHKIQNVMGYHAAKLKIYQTFLERSGLEARNRFGLSGFMAKYYDVVFRQGRPSLQPVPPANLPAVAEKKDNAILDMLNVKYLISLYPIPDEQDYRMVHPEQPFVYENIDVLPRAYFAEKVHTIDDENQFYSNLLGGNFNPAKEAYLLTEPPFEIGSPEKNQVKITRYDPREIVLSASVAEPALMVLSEIFYPAGWKAYVDGVETEIYRTNAILRSIFMQPGEHEIRFEFNPSSFYIGLWITIATLVLMVGLLIFDWKFRRPVSTENAANQ